MSSLQDGTLLGHMVDTGVDDFACALKVYEGGTPEAKNLLLNETAPVFECKSCRALFRCIDAFVAHKQDGCQPMATSMCMSDHRSREVIDGAPNWETTQGKRVRLYQGNPDYDYNDIYKASMQRQVPNSAVNKAATCDARAKSAKDQVITNGYNSTATTQQNDQRYKGGTSATHARGPAPLRWTVVVNPRRTAPASTTPRSDLDSTAHDKRREEQRPSGLHTPKDNAEQEEMCNSPGSPVLLTPPSETASLSSQSSSGSDSHRRSARQRIPSKRLQPYILDPLLSPPSEEPSAEKGKKYNEVHRDLVQRKNIVRVSTDVQPLSLTRVVTARRELARRIEDAIKGGKEEAAKPRMPASCDIRACEKPKEVPTDLAQVPVLMTAKQRDLFFSPLRPLFAARAKDGLHQCAECGTLARSQQEGYRHVIGHVRAIRMQCRLCNAGAFYCQDMRRHIMYRHCERLQLAPDGYVDEGTVVPCMDVKKADKLVRFSDVDRPGRLTYTTGKIVSCMNPRAHFPDPITEARIVGAH